MRFTAKEIGSIIHVLEQAVTEHSRWLNDWHRSLIFGLPLAEVSFSKDAYRRCGFGRWYDSQSSPILREHADFIEIGKRHRALHDRAYVLALSLKRDEPVSLQDYDNFTNEERNFSQAVLKLRDELREILCQFDPLTDILNRQAFFRILSQEYARASRTGQPGCISMVDLDHFKAINDTYGHMAGDRVLHAAAQYFADRLRPYDSIGRYGGEEFLICLPNTTLDIGRKIIDRLRRGLASLSISVEKEKAVHVTGSFGLARLATGIPLDQNIARADEALYAAKHAGRNQVVAYDFLHEP